MSLPKPVGAQIKVLALPSQGHYVVLGTAGSGKTTLAIHRAVYLAKLDPAKRVLLVTFNRALVTYLNAISDVKPANLDIRGFHQFARGYLAHRGKMGNNDISEDPIWQVERAQADLIQQYPNVSILERPGQFFVEEFVWMARSGNVTLESYVQNERTGRTGTKVNRRDRPYVFMVYERYKQLRQQDGYRYDWADLAMAAWEEFLSDTDPRMYEHVVIDEGQDFSPVMLKTLVSAIPDTGSITFFGDVAQQIYGSRVSWRSAGLNIGSIWEFKENYRNTPQVAALALALASTPLFKSIPDMVLPTTTRADGPLPTLVVYQDKDQERAAMVEAAIRFSTTQHVAILVRNRQEEAAYRSELENRGVRPRRLHRRMATWSFDPGVTVGTYHSSKGLEFDTVIMPNCSADALPDPDRILALGDDEDAQVEAASLLYVSITRAKYRLALSYTDALTPLLPTQDTLYQKVDRR